MHAILGRVRGQPYAIRRLPAAQPGVGEASARFTAAENAGYSAAPDSPDTTLARLFGYGPAPDPP